MKVENFKQFSLKMLHYEARAFPVGTCMRLYDTSAIFTPRKMHMCMNLDHAWLVAILFSGEMFIASSIIGHASKYAYARSVKLLCL